MNFIKKIVILGLVTWPAVCSGQIYRAGQTSSEDPKTSISNWDISLGVYRSNLELTDPTQETLLSKERGLSARGVYAFSSWLAAGVEGGFSKRENLPAQNTYRHLYYGVITKWILTPQTKPRVYLLLGGGVSQRKLSYAGDWSHTVTNPYALAGTGVELDVGSWGYVGLEAQARYNTKRKLDEFAVLDHRLETVLGVRGGVRF